MATKSMLPPTVKKKPNYPLAVDVMWSQWRSDQGWLQIEWLQMIKSELIRKCNPWNVHQCDKNISKFTKKLSDLYFWVFTLAHVLTWKGRSLWETAASQMFWSSCLRSSHVSHRYIHLMSYNLYYMKLLMWNVELMFIPCWTIWGQVHIQNLVSNVIRRCENVFWKVIFFVVFF